MPPLLSIGYPTYCRAEAVVAAVEVALREIRQLPIELIVADNASSDGTVNQLMQRFPGSSLRIVAGKINSGWKGNFERLAMNASSDYLLLMSDEDDVADAATLNQLLAVLSNGRHPSLVTTGATVIPGVRERFRAEDVWEGVHYMSGTVFRTREALKWLEAIDGLARNHDVAELWELFPHYMIALGIWLSGGECIKFGGEVHIRQRQFPMRWTPQHRGPGDRELMRTGQQTLGRAYHKSISSNILQSAALATYIDVLESTMPIDTGRAQDLRRWQADRIAKKVDGLIAFYFPELYPSWRTGIRRRHSMWQRLVSRASQLLKHDPRRLLGRLGG